MLQKLNKDRKLILLMLFSLIIIGVIILSNFFSFRSIEHLTIQQLINNKLVETKFAATQIESHINKVRDELITSSKFPLLNTLNSEKCNQNSVLTSKKSFEHLLQADKSGQVVCSSEDFSDYLGLNIKDKEYFKIPQETNEPFITGIVKHGLAKQIIVSVPLFETTQYTPYPNFLGEFKGVLFNIIELNKLNLLYLHSLASKESFFILVDLETKKVVLQSEVVSPSEIDIFFSKDNDKVGTIKYVEGLGETIITSSDLIFGSEHWRLIILTPLKNIGNEIKVVQKRHLISLTFVIVIVVITLFLLILLYRSKEEIKLELVQAKTTLEKLGLNIALEGNNYNQADIVLEPKKVYLVRDDEENNAWELFIGSLNQGFAGLGIVRENPKIIRKKYNLQKTSLLWLTDNKIEDVPCESDFETIFNVIAEFIRKGKKSVILFEGLDYLSLENDFDLVIKKLHSLKDFVSVNNCIMIIAVNTKLLEVKKLKVLEALTVDLYGKDLEKKVELSEQEQNILRFINERNINHQLTSYKDINTNFKITKPTTRIKISKLQQLGLLQIEQRGRFKALKITSLGRKLV